MTAAIVAGIFLAVCTYVACLWLTDYVTRVSFTSEEAVKKNVGEAYESLQKFIDRRDVKATDSDKLKKWVEEYEDVYLYIWDNNNTYIFEAGWYATGAEADSPDEDLTLGVNLQIEDNSGRIDRSAFTEDVQNRIVKFADREYYVFIDVYKQVHWQQGMSIASIILSFFVLLTVLLVYHNHVVKRIMALAADVGRVKDGDLEYSIEGTRNDEIGLLADSVDEMRDSILEKHRSEKEAWEANNQLITSMSHDIRTPLTSMIGYLDIIEGKKYESQADLDRYISSCREKAFQLKDLSDKLFQYFLVFGKKESDQELELMDANILFQQLLQEHCAEIISYGYKVEFYFNIPEVTVQVEISSLQRLFDNIFSNIMKYADKREVVCIYAEAENGQIKILAINGMPEEAKKVESTRIGLLTCEKICSDLGGEFSYDEQDRMFTVRILLPIKETEAEEEPSSESPEKGEETAESHGLQSEESETTDEESVK